MLLFSSADKLLLTCSLLNLSQALGYCSSYLELKRIYPNTGRLYKLLQQSLYRGPAHENDIDASKLVSAVVQSCILR